MLVSSLQDKEETIKDMKNAFAVKNAEIDALSGKVASLSMTGAERAELEDLRHRVQAMMQKFGPLPAQEESLQAYQARAASCLVEAGKLKNLNISMSEFDERMADILDDFQKQIDKIDLYVSGGRRTTMEDILCAIPIIKYRSHLETFKKLTKGIRNIVIGSNEYHIFQKWRNSVYRRLLPAAFYEDSLGRIHLYQEHERKLMTFMELLQYDLNYRNVPGDGGKNDFSIIFQQTRKYLKDYYGLSI